MWHCSISGTDLDGRVERTQRAFPRVRQAHLDEGHVSEAQLFGVQHGAVALDEPLRLQLSHAGLAGRFRQADPPRKLGHRHAPIRLARMLRIARS
jgi:hypothetical protein